MSNIGKNNLWKTIGKQQNPSQTHSKASSQHKNEKQPANHMNQSSQRNNVDLPVQIVIVGNGNNSRDKNSVGKQVKSQMQICFDHNGAMLASPSPFQPQPKSNRPPSLIISNPISPKHFNHQTDPHTKSHPPHSQHSQISKNGHLIKNQIQPDVNHLLSPKQTNRTPSRKIALNHHEDIHEQQQESSWINANGDRISNVHKKSNIDEDLSFSIGEDNDPFNNVDDRFSKFQRKQSAISYDPSGRIHQMETAKQNPYHLQNAPSMKNKDNIPISRIPQVHNRPKCRQIQEIEDVFHDVDQNFQQNQRSKPKYSSEQKFLTNQIKTLKETIQTKTYFINKLKLQLNYISQKTKSLKMLFSQQLKKFPEQLLSFKNQTILKIQSDIHEKFIDYQFSMKKFNQGCLEEEYEKRKLVQNDYQIQKKIMIEQQAQIRVHDSEKAKLEKLIRDLQYSSASAQSELQQMSRRAKQLSTQRSQLHITIQTLQQRNKSLKDHINVLTKNIHSKSIKEGQSDEDLYWKNSRLKKEAEEKDREIKALLEQKQKLKREQEVRLDQYEREFRQVEAKMSEYRKKVNSEVEELKEELKSQQNSHQQTRHSSQQLQLKLKQTELDHYKQIEQYDNTLRQIEKDLEILSLKKNIKEEELNRKQIQLSKRENQMVEKNDLVRQKRNQLECAIQLYRKNLLLLEKKEDFLTGKYHEAVEIETSAKSAWYERYYKLYSPSALFNANSQQKNGKSTTNKFNKLSLKSVRSQDSPKPMTQRVPFVEPSIYSDMKKMVINQRLSQIGSLKSHKKIKEQSPRNLRVEGEVLSRPHSPRAINLIHKAKSVETQRRFLKSPLRQRPQRDQSTKNPMISLSIARSSSPKPITRQCNKQFSVVKAKLDQIKSSINNEMTVVFNKGS